jgi:histidinol-phosphate aminotransferase
MPETLGPINRVKEPFAVNLLAQAAGVAALEDEAFLAQTVQANRDGRRYLYGEFGRLGLEFVESHANFVLVRVGPDAAAVQQRLIEQGILVRPCGGYGLDEFLRVTVGTPAQNARFVDALAQFLGCR